MSELASAGHPSLHQAWRVHASAAAYAASALVSPFPFPSPSSEWVWSEQMRKRPGQTAWTAPGPHPLPHRRQ